MKRFFLGGGIALVALFWAAFLSWQENDRNKKEVSLSSEEQKVVIAPVEESVPASEEKEIPSEVQGEAVSLPVLFSITDVPFTPQAPFALWGNPTFQDACEEASIIMANAWVKKKTLSQDDVKKEIESMVVFEKKKFGQAVDTSLADTAWLLREYFSLTTMEVKTDITVDDIQKALAKGRIVIVPTDGRKLKNPNFKQPGPMHHMLVITGYNQTTKEFTTNDPGTRNGKAYRYSEDILYEAILDYATGNHVPVVSTDKVMLTVWRE